MFQDSVADDASPHRESRRRFSTMSQLAGRHILLVEDEPLVAMTIEEMLIESGCDVVGPVDRIDDAIAAIAESRIDAAILDLNVGGGPSYRVADVLLERRIPFLFATGIDRMGIDPHYAGRMVLTKPFRPGDLSRSLEELLSQ